MDVLAVVLSVLLIGVVGGAVVLFRDAGQQLLSGDYRRRIADSEAEARERANTLRALYEDYRDQLKTLQQRQIELETTLTEVRSGAHAVEQERDRLFDQIRRSGQQLDERIATLAERKAELAPPKPPAQLTTGAGDAGGRLTARRAEILGELYERLAKVEFSIVSLTNPVLLPGESFSVPGDLPPELMEWDNWREVGEASFALGEYFNQHRIQLDLTTARAIEAGIATVRTTLTQEIYPSLADAPASERPLRIREALNSLTIIPRLRRYLESQYRTQNGLGDPDEPENEPPTP